MRHERSSRQQRNLRRKPADAAHLGVRDRQRHQQSTGVVRHDDPPRVIEPGDDRSLARVVGLGARDADTDAIELLERREIHRPSG